MSSMMTEMQRLVDASFEEFRRFDLAPEHLRAGGDDIPAYLQAHRHEYIQTLVDVMALARRGECRQVLEIGAFFGVVCICLARLGLEVCAADIPEYMSMPEQRRRYARYGIRTAEIRLEDYLLPFPDEQFDLIIMCEVLEHLNFNPLPLIKEINRIGRPESGFYLSLPNLAQYRKRLRLLFGRSVHDPIRGFFDQLDPNASVITNGHWREYTGPEVRSMLEKMGYRIERQYYFSVVQTFPRPTLKNRVTRAVYRLAPSLMENQRVMARREQRTPLVFHIPRTVHPTLATL